MEPLAPRRIGPRPRSPLAVLQERLERKRIVRDEAVLGTCRYADFCQAVRVRNDVLSIVAHDLRDSLHLIAGSAALIRDLPLEQPEIRRHAGVITRTVERIDRLVRDLLDVSRIEAGTLALDARPTRPETLVDEAVQLLGPTAAEAGIELKARICGPLPEVDVDPVRIVQVLANLVGNALKFTPRGGRVRVRVAAEPDPRRVRFSVVDNGVGIPEQNIVRLFDRFWQADAARASGAGLGLVIVKGIVEQHGGTISVESEPGRGSAFHFTVPVARQARPPP
jgi:signal transduction histidine kinase